MCQDMKHNIITWLHCSVMPSNSLTLALTEETSSGRIKIIRNEKYQATRTATVTIIWCFSQFPYLYSKPAAKQNVTTTSVKSGPNVMINFYSICWLLPLSIHENKYILKATGLFQLFWTFICCLFIFSSASFCIFSNFSSVTDFSGINLGLQRMYSALSSWCRKPLWEMYSSNADIFPSSDMIFLITYTYNK